MKISIVFMVKDSEKYCYFFGKLINILEEQYAYDFEYFVYENDSSDLTKTCLHNFMKNRKGMLITENTYNPCNKDNKKNNMEGILKSRGIHMCRLRNKLKKYHGILYSDYTLLIDSDVIFHEKTLKKMLDVFKYNSNIAMVTPYCICYKMFLLYNDDHHYYDSFAVQTNGKRVTWKNNDNTCMFSQCERCINYRKALNINIDDADLFKMDLESESDLEYVDSAFGGFCLIKTDVYNKIEWGETICEHHSFCDNVKQFGEIVIAKKIKTFTTVPEHSNLKEFLNMVSILKRYY